MILSNIYTRPEIPDSSQRVPFNTLKQGGRFKYTNTGGIHQVHFIGPPNPLGSPDWMTIKMEDDWLVRVTPTMEGFNKLVIKI